MGFRTLGVFLTTLCLMTSALVSANDMATNSSAISSGSGSETVAQLLAEVQAAVADDPALANMFDISSTSQMSEEELTTLLQDILDVSLSGSGSSSSNSSSSSSSSSSTTSASAEATQSASAAGSTVSGATTVTLSAAFGVLAMVAALGATL
ncbi:hypothetical protein PC129_g10401 [Phytophthora cactorum]|uniref:Uncharacterized protein n=1 Tax=Phytophthora cactorum TaxID=29920 RepID=A0A329SXG0_9STRA|nr:hypothetical protein Pcac1_g18552 [Phytophthora cactorum]KAG2831253.1 hypothetical protein PC112_g7362 [Phytophthora cactorum]KAG2833854.1 hypothetical protein PC111_g6068 [Phytophthora cactorum]KAG2861163.1 hypothetical protein PC113_g7414 [Phytophthora cactorum]KAG2916575.1 hypothetical protein PC114_g7443 [Phytophthora cactorum]